MPLYEYKCKTCGRVEEKFNTIDQHKNGPICCGDIMPQLLGNYYVHGDLQPYVDHNLSEKPIVVKSKKHREQLMRENNVSEKFGKGWL